MREITAYKNVPYRMKSRIINRKPEGKTLNFNQRADSFEEKFGIFNDLSRRTCEVISCGVAWMTEKNSVLVALKHLLKVGAKKQLVKRLTNTVHYCLMQIMPSKQKMSLGSVRCMLKHLHR